MLRNQRVFLSALALGAVVSVLSSATLAGTIIKLNLGNSGPDVGMTGGVLSTVNDTPPGPLGDQYTSIEYTDFLNPIPDISAPIASFSLGGPGLTAAGAPSVFGSLVIQNFTGGRFSLWDPANVLLLTGPLANSALTGVTGPPGTGALFTTTLGTVDGGTLQGFILPNTVSLSMNLTNVRGGLGFAVDGVLLPFMADASINISADPTGTGPGIPEPATLTMLVMASACIAGISRRRR